MTNLEKNSDLRSVIERFQLHRSDVYSWVVRQLRNLEHTNSSFGNLTISEIREHAIEAYLQQWTSGRRVDWNWRVQREAMRRKRPSYWEMAIWHRQTLCGLVLGKPSKHRTRLYIEGIEGHPGQHPLKGNIIPIALLASERYAEAIGCKEVWLVEPDPALLDRYREAGYNLMLRHKLLKKFFGAKSFATKEL